MWAANAEVRVARAFTLAHDIDRLLPSLDGYLTRKEIEERIAIALTRELLDAAQERENMKISEQGLDLIRQHEGCRLESYQDIVGIWTIGYGHTKGVQRGTACTQEQAETWLSEDVKEAETCIAANVLTFVPLTQGEYDALASFIFNLGCRAFKNSTLLKKLLASDYDGAQAEFAKWNHAGGVEVAGLTARRKAEVERFEDTA